MKTVNFEISKRLNELWLLDNIETGYSYRKDLIDRIPNKYFVLKWYMEDAWDIKTLTLEESIEFIPYSLLIENRKYKDEQWITRINSYTIQTDYYLTWNKKQLIFAIEEMISYLLDNNLLTK